MFCAVFANMPVKALASRPVNYVNYVASRPLTRVDAVAEAFAERTCADLNLLHAFNELELEPSDVLMVGVTANEVGFGDELDSYD